MGQGDRARGAAAKRCVSFFGNWDDPRPGTSELPPMDREDPGPRFRMECWRWPQEADAPFIQSQRVTVAFGNCPHGIDFKSPYQEPFAESWWVRPSPRPRAWRRQRWTGQGGSWREGWGSKKNSGFLILTFCMGSRGRTSFGFRCQACPDEIWDGKSGGQSSQPSHQGEKARNFKSHSCQG